MAEQLSTPTEETSKFLSRSSDYLGDLGTKLRNLIGYATLAFELIQNADDAPDASSICFDVREDSLVVDNDGVFSDCGHIDQTECIWKQRASQNHRCDFHSFRLIASGDKRDRPGTTGAFGIGFIAVYQITDRPELISGGRHWILREEQPEEKRIRVCSGCRTCQSEGFPGTKFILPFAFDPDTALRRALRTAAVNRKCAAQLLAELRRVLPGALVFLKRIRRIELKQNRTPLLRLERIEDGQSLLINDGREDRVWHLLRGEFHSEAAVLKAKEPFRIEEKRTAEVTLAVPAKATGSGLLCACLPTQYETGLPFHVNADFFPTNDRKGVVFESDYQSEWNRVATDAAARALKVHLQDLPTLLGHERLWELLFAVHQVHEEALKGKREHSLGAFWREITDELRSAKFGFSAAGEWYKSCDVLLLQKEEENEAAPILQALGIPTLHPSLRSFVFQLPWKEAFGIEQLELGHIIKAVHQEQFDKRRETRDFAKYFPTKNDLSVLWREVGRLLEREGKQNRSHLEKELAACALVLGRDGALWPCKDIYRADKDTVEIFSHISSTIPFAADAGVDAEVVLNLCRPFDSKEAIQWLSSSVANGSVKDGQFEPSKLLAWFEVRKEEVLRSDNLKRALKSLPIFPCSTGLKPLTQIALPGGFADPIGLTDLVDLSVLSGRQDFLLELGVNELTFEVYARLHIPEAFQNPHTDPAKKEKAVRLLSDRLGSVKDKEDVRSALSAAPVILCTDGVYRRPEEVYLPADQVTTVLGETVRLAALPSHNREACRDLYRWLGVEEKPRFSDIMARIKSLVAVPPDEISIRTIQAIVSYLGGQLPGYDELPPELSSLGTIAWLPIRGSGVRWFRPTEVHPSFSAYLFESQGQFLNVPDEIQRSSTGLLRLLGVRLYPTAAQVVRHLLNCAQNNLPVNPKVYEFLNQNAQDASLEVLKSQRCLCLPGGTYARPSEVFWGRHPFGTFRHRLGPELRVFNDLLSRLGIQESPSTHDAMSVLKQVASEFGRPHRKLEEGAHEVVMACWRLLSEALESGQLQPGEIAELHMLEVIPNALGILLPPEWMFFEDRAGLAEKFGDFLRPNVVPRVIGSWPAMAAAGVRSLREAVESELVECSDPVTDQSVRERILNRRHQLARVAESQATALGIKADLTNLDKMQIVSVTCLEVQYFLRFFQYNQRAAPESVLTHLRHSDFTLFFRRQIGEEPPWASIARELAQVICPEQEPGAIASGFKEVLAAENKEKAASVLNELGFPVLQAPITEEASEGPLIEHLGHEAGGPAGGEPIPTPDLGRQAVTERQAVTGEEPGANRQVAAHKTGRERGRLRTYVTPDLPERESHEDSSAAVQRSEIEQEGIRRVMEFEIQGGRFPKEMPPNHPGYDIESFDGSGQIERYIEVKSCSGEWDSLGVAMSDTQFEKAYLEKERFWLYVVERAKQENFEIHAIRDPARKVDEFFYDHGWRSVAEMTQGNMCPIQDQTGE